jgi:hypothetical protein
MRQTTIYLRVDIEVFLDLEAAFQPTSM